MFDFTNSTGGILDVSGGIVGSLMPLILLFGGLCLGIIIFKSIMNVFKIKKIQLGVRKKIGFLRERGYEVRELTKDEKREKRESKKEKSIVAELKKLDFIIKK